MQAYLSQCNYLNIKYLGRTNCRPVDVRNVKETEIDTETKTETKKK